jgi:hypothetical protein
MNFLIDRRAENVSRVPVSVPLEFTSEGVSQPCEGDCVNLSTGGVSIRTHFVPEVGEDIVCRFEVADQGPVIEVNGRVAWAHEEAEHNGRFGLRFTGIDRHSRVRIAQVVGEQSLIGAALPSEAKQTAELLLDGIQTPISAQIIQRRGRLLVFEQELPLLQIGRGVLAKIPGAEPISGRIASLDLRLQDGMPRLTVTVGITNNQKELISENAEVREPARFSRFRFIDHAEPSFFLLGSHFRELRDRWTMLVEKFFENFIPRLWLALGRVRGLLIPARPRRTVGPIQSPAQSSVVGKKRDHAGEKSRLPFILGAGALGLGLVVALLNLSIHPIDGQTRPRSARIIRLNGQSQSLPIANPRASSAPIDDRATAAVSRKVEENGFPVNGVKSASETRTAQPSISTSIRPVLSHPATGSATPPSELTSAPSVNSVPSSKALQSKPSVAAGPNQVLEENVTFGAREVRNGKVFRLRMSNKVSKLQGIPDKQGFTVIIPGSLSLDRAGSIASSHPSVKRSMIVNKGDHSELTIGFASGTSPAYRVTGKGASLEIVIASPKSSES